MSDEPQKPVHYFSNGTEFYSWMDSWCCTCKHDRATKTQDEGMCQVPVPALLGETVPEWGIGPSGFMQMRVYCTKYEEAEKQESSSPDSSSPRIDFAILSVPKETDTP